MTIDEAIVILNENRYAIIADWRPHKRMEEYVIGDIPGHRGPGLDRIYMRASEAVEIAERLSADTTGNLNRAWNYRQGFHIGIDGANPGTRRLDDRDFCEGFYKGSELRKSSRAAVEALYRVKL